MTRIAVSVRTAARMMLSDGHTVEEVQSFINNSKQDVRGFVYVDELPVKKMQKAA